MNQPSTRTTSRLALPDQVLPARLVVYAALPYLLLCSLGFMATALLKTAPFFVAAALVLDTTATLLPAGFDSSVHALAALIEAAARFAPAELDILV